MKIMVTGGAGFIGSAYVKAALSAGHSVVNVDKLTYAADLSSLASVAEHPDYAFERVDICDVVAVPNLLQTYQPDAVVNLAAESHVDRSIDGPGDFIQTNIVGTYNLLQACRAHFNSLTLRQKSKFRFHHVSTDEVFGDLRADEDAFTELTPYAPSSPYSASKAASDHLVRAWARTYDLPILVTNCSNNYGPFQFPEKLIPHMILKALSGQPMPVYGDGQQIRDWLFVSDHVAALLQVLEFGRLGETYNIGGWNEKTNLEVVHTICEHLERLVPKKPDGITYYTDLITFVKDRPGHDRRYAIDATKIKSELGWKPSESFESGLMKTVEWYAENMEWCESHLNGQYELGRLGQV